MERGRARTRSRMRNDVMPKLDSDPGLERFTLFFGCRLQYIQHCFLFASKISKIHVVYVSYNMKDCNLYIYLEKSRVVIRNLIMRGEYPLRDSKHRTLPSE